MPFAEQLKDETIKSTESLSKLEHIINNERITLKRLESIELSLSQITDRVFGLSPEPDSNPTESEDISASFLEQFECIKDKQHEKINDIQVQIDILDQL
jgi:hypothetical protein